MSMKRSSISGPPKSLRWIEKRQDGDGFLDMVVEAILSPVGIGSEERVLIVGTDAEALEIMCSLLRLGVTQVMLLCDRWPRIAAHSITLILVSSLTPRTQVFQAIEMAPRVLRKSGRLVFGLFRGRTSEPVRIIEAALRRIGYGVNQKETELGRFLCAVPATQRASHLRSRSGQTSESRSALYPVG
jgi:hypothetical protein